MTKYARAAAAACLFLACAGRTPTAQPAWSDDSRSQLSAQGTTVATNSTPPPPQAAPIPQAEPAPVVVAAAPVAGAEPRAEDDAPPPPNAPAVHVLDLGTAPRTLLRYRLKGPATEEMTLMMTTAMTTTITGVPSAGEITAPTTRMLMSMASAPAGKGELSANARITDADTVDTPGVPPFLRDQVRTELRKVVGMSIDSRLTTRGAVIKVDTTLPPDAPASTRGMIEGLQSSFGRSGVLPAEPVGVGAHWEIDTVLKQNGIEVRDHTSYRVRELAGTRVALDVEIVLNADAQEIKLPTGGGSMQLDSMRGNGSGTVELDLASLVPRQQHVAMENDMAMHMPMGGRTMAMSMHMKMGIVLHAGR